METIIFHDFSSFSERGRAAKLTENQFCIYSHKRADKKSGTKTLSFGGLKSEYENGFKFLNLAENSLTGELFLVLTKSKGVELSVLKGGYSKSGKIGTQKNNVVNFMLDKLCLSKTESVNVVFELSNNLSKTPDNLTFKIILK